MKERIYLDASIPSAYFDSRDKNRQEITRRWWEEIIFERYDVSMEMKQEEIDQITPLENFFIMGSNIPKEMDELAKDPNIYRLEITGEVENPVNLTYEDLMTQFEFKH